MNVFSPKTVGVPGDNFDFVCFDPSRTALNIQWLVNGTLLENSRLVNVFQEYNNRSKTADLSFNLPLEHNVTTIQCIGNFASENVSSESITLLLQGQLLLELLYSLYSIIIIIITLLRLTLHTKK